MNIFAFDSIVDATLTFHTQSVQSIINYTRKCKSWRVPYEPDKPGKPGLFLVADEGVYLISNGIPEGENKQQAVYAIEADPSTTSFDQWWRVRSQVFRGDDGIEWIPLSSFGNITTDYIEMIISENQIVIKNKPQIQQILHFRQNELKVTPQLINAIIAYAYKAELVNDVFKKGLPSLFWEHAHKAVGKNCDQLLQYRNNQKIKTDVAMLKACYTYLEAIKNLPNCSSYKEVSKYIKFFLDRLEKDSPWNY